MTKSRDQIYSDAFNQIEAFSFDETVASVFSDMLQRSVPGYATTIANIAVLAKHYVQANSHCYDLGCSLGAATLAMLHTIEQQDCKIFAVDNSEAMLMRCQAALDAVEHTVPVELVHDDISRIAIEKASLVILNFTLQFIEPKHRLSLLKTIYNGMLGGGVLVLSEKVIFDDAVENDLLVDLHHDFKKANGYSQLEISQKRTALENVLLSDTIDQHMTRLHDAGFTQVYRWFQCFNFISILAVK